MLAYARGRLQDVAGVHWQDADAHRERKVFTYDIVAAAAVIWQHATPSPFPSHARDPQLADTRAGRLA